MTAYQRRKKEVAYYQQCVRELEEIVEAMVARGARVPFTGAGISGDTILTPYNSGEFALRMSMR